MLWNRNADEKKIMRMMKWHWYPMFLVMEYIQYTDIYRYAITRHELYYEEKIDIVDASITGIKITYDKEIKRCRRLKIKAMNTHAVAMIRKKRLLKIWTDSLGRGSSRQ